MSFDSLFKDLEVIHLDKDQVLHRSDEKCHSMGIVVEGELHLSRLLSNGKELHIRSFHSGDLFAELIVFTGGYYPGWLTARKPTQVIEVPLHQITEYLSASSNLVSFMTGIARKMTQLGDMIEIHSLKTVRQKIAFALIYGEFRLEDVSPPKPHTSGFQVSHFAQYIGCSREAVSRALSEMESESLIEREDGNLYYSDKKKLEALLTDVNGG